MDQHEDLINAGSRMADNRFNRVSNVGKSLGQHSILECNQRLFFQPNAKLHAREIVVEEVANVTM